MPMDSLRGQLKYGLVEAIFHWVIWVKLLKKKHSVSPNIVVKSPIGLMFCRNMCMDSLQGQLTWLKNGLAEVIFYMSYLSKITQKSIP